MVLNLSSFAQNTIQDTVNSLFHITKYHIKGLSHLDSVAPEALPFYYGIIFSRVISLKDAAFERPSDEILFHAGSILNVRRQNVSISLGMRSGKSEKSRTDTCTVKAR